MKFFTSPVIKKFHISKASTRMLGILCTVVFLNVSVVTPVQAGVISYVNSLFGSEQVSANVVNRSPAMNSQTIALLQAPTNTEPNSEKAYMNVPVVGNVLVADIAFSDSGDNDVHNVISSYIVREGDTISSIADMFNVSVNTVIWANNIERGTVLKQGQIIIILPVTGVKYTVKNGDTIRSIALAHKADVSEIIKINDIRVNSVLKSGQTLIIPDAELTASPQYRTDNPAHDINGKSYPGYYSRPVIGGTRTQGLHGHNGVDIAAAVGTPLYAAADGAVIVSTTGGYNGGYGTFIIISHDNGTQTVYAHNSENLVRVGQRVKQGEQIARMGATGKATGSHIHFEIRGAKNPF